MSFQNYVSKAALAVSSLLPTAVDKGLDLPSVESTQKSTLNLDDFKDTTWAGELKTPRTRVLPGPLELAQGPQGAYFEFNLADRKVAGLDTDPAVPSRVYQPVAQWLDSHLAKTGGVLEHSDPKWGTYSERIESNELRQAIDTARVITRNIVRRRALDARTSGRPIATNAPDNDEIHSAVEHLLNLKVFYKDTPIVMSVLGADPEAEGTSFGVPAEIDGWNRTNEAYGIPAVKGPLRDVPSFTQAIANTPPRAVKSDDPNVDGTLVFTVCFNGHGAPGGEGMSLPGGNGLMVAPRDIGAALKENIEKNADLLAEADKANKRVVYGVHLYCCFASDQARNNFGNESQDLISQLEDLAAKHRIRFYVLTVGETMRPGLYQPGTNLPVLGARAVIRASDDNDGLLKMENLYPSIMHGGEDIISNPTLIVPDRKKAAAFQIGANEDLPNLPGKAGEIQEANDPEMHFVDGAATIERGTLSEKKI